MTQFAASVDDAVAGIADGSLLAVPREVSGVPMEATRATAAMGMGLATDWSAISRFVSHADRLEPDPAKAGAYAQGYASFRKLYPPIAALDIKET